MRGTDLGHPGRLFSRAGALPTRDLREQLGQLRGESGARQNGRAAVARTPDRLHVAVPRESQHRRARRGSANARDRRERVQRALLEIDDRERRLSRRELAVELLRRLRDAGVRVAVVMPGSVATDLTPSSGDPSWKLTSNQIADSVWYLVTQPESVLVSRIEIRPARTKGTR